MQSNARNLDEAGLLRLFYFLCTIADNSGFPLPKIGDGQRLFISHHAKVGEELYQLAGIEYTPRPMARPFVASR